MMTGLRFLRSAALLALLLLTFTGRGSTHAAVQQENARKLEATPSVLILSIGEEVELSVEVTGADGKPEDIGVVFFSRSRGAVDLDVKGPRSTRVIARKPGDFEMVARTLRSDGPLAEVRIPVSVAYAPLASIRFLEPPGHIYTESRIKLGVEVLDETGLERSEITPRVASSNEAVARFDAFGYLVALAPGTTTLEAVIEDLTFRHQLEVRANPVRRVEVTTAATHARTGDVLAFEAVAYDGTGQPVPDAPLRFSFRATLDDDLGNGATGQIEDDGRFVAEQPGLYSIMATSGSVTGGATVRIDTRNVQRKIKLLGQGQVQDVHTSDLWVWEGHDGRDYAVTGTWGANGEAIFWDVTDPTGIERISSVTVDARTVNDVKISPDGSLCILSREGASDRKNGIVIIDVADPRNPEIISTFTEELTGGVHNLFIYDDHVFALSAGRRYDIIDIANPREPKRVGTFELDTPGHSIHDVWVVDGIAYSSNWQDGVWLVDVGNGVRGGTVEKPVAIAHYAYPSGWNHAAFPYWDETTGKFYVIAGDEAFPYGLNVEDRPTYPRGWLHFIDFTDPDAPKEVARYEVPEAGTHNLWVEGDTLYVAYYNGGLRVVDLSGELMGDLYKQGREIAWYLPDDPEGKIANAPMVWGPQPHKGTIFFSDWNSGLWAAELEEPQGE